MMTKLSRMDSSSSSLKYSVKTCPETRSSAGVPRPTPQVARTETSLWRKVRSSAAFEFFLVSATTGRSEAG